MCHHIVSFMADSPYLPAQQLSKIFIAFAKLGQLLVLIFTLIFRISQRRMSRTFYPPSLSNSPVNPMISLQSSMNSIHPTTMDPGGLGIMRLWNA